MQQNRFSRFSSRLIFGILVFMTGMAPAAFGQVGINNADPHPSAILDLTATDKGLLIPRINSLERRTMNKDSKPAHGLLVFDTELNMFFFYDGTANKWIALNPWNFGAPEGPTTDPATLKIHTYPDFKGNVGIGTLDPGEKLEVNGNIKASGDISAEGEIRATGKIVTEGEINAKSISLTDGSAPIPPGGIIMWSGSVADIPAGWALCNAENNVKYGTPNLTDRFIVGAGGTYAPGATGGANNVTITVAHMPSHSHRPGTLNIVTSGGHTHTTNAPKEELKKVGNNSTGDGESAQRPNAEGIVSGDGGHTHPSSTFRGETASKGGGQAHENRPPYYALAFIMKLPN